MIQCDLLSPAKINLCLHVLGKRTDGYHVLAMAMQRVDLCDRVRLTVHDEAGPICCRGVALADGEENIASRAARLILAEAGLSRAVDIDIDKKIPVAAGLGGGSSNAATVLVGLDRMLNLGVGQRRLMEMGLSLGADVPFFVFGRPAWATGIGEQLEPLSPLPQVCYLLVHPGFKVSTAWVYQSLQLTISDEVANLPRFSVGSSDELIAHMTNDLERVTVSEFPEIEHIKDVLLDNGARGALMSGSGATVFGVYADFESARVAGERLSARYGWTTYPVRPLDAPL
ncbi:MAG: 4-(cytidine 5'-diphospho)-2-C-methyl-D-erythritol kinase [Desulfuromonas sp.]|nr:MAG: 4-(cytidine 5'-diphospho)-2-C-methyl-D-erythritol kinase [Desulfuromonas sp.]